MYARVQDTPGEIAQCRETGATKHTFACIAVSRPFGRGIVHIAVITNGEKTRRIGYGVATVHITNVLVHLLTVEPGLRRTGFEVKYRVDLDTKSMSHPHMTFFGL